MKTKHTLEEAENKLNQSPAFFKTLNFIENSEIFYFNFLGKEIKTMNIRIVSVLAFACTFTVLYKKIRIRISALKASLSRLKQKQGGLCLRNECRYCTSPPTPRSSESFSYNRIEQKNVFVHTIGHIQCRYVIETINEMYNI